MSAILDLQDGSFAYDRKPIFEGLGLQLHPGRVAALLGPNGCGKTTLLRCLGGALPMQKGQVLLNGRSLSSYGEAERARQIGFVFQGHRAIFPYTVIEAVCMGRTPHLGFLGLPSRSDIKIAEQALDTVGCAHLRDNRYTEISGGERQLVLIARALAQDPAILLLDEPTSHLDFGNQMLLLTIVERLAREKKLAVLMSTHFPDHALLVADHVYLMKEGRFVAQGRPSETITADHLRILYGIDVQIVSVEGDGNAAQQVAVPLLRIPGRS